MALGHCPGQGLSAGDIRQQRKTACDRTCEEGVYSVGCVRKGCRRQEPKRDLRRTSSIAASRHGRRFSAPLNLRLLRSEKRSSFWQTGGFRGTPPPPGLLGSCS